MDGDRLLDVLGNEYARSVLVAAADGPRSVDELTDRTDASRPTVYRQVEDLRDLGLLTERRGYDDGTHFRSYETRVNRLSLEFAVDGIRVGIHQTDDRETSPVGYDTSSADDSEVF